MVMVDNPFRRRQMPTPVKEEEPGPLAEAIRQELLKLLSEPLTAMRMGQVKRLADASYKLLLASLPKATSLAVVGGLIEPDEGGLAPGYDGPVYSGNMQVGVGQETYGSTVIRELFTSLTGLLGPKKKDDDPVELIKAIAEAKKEGMSDIEAMLRARLAVALGAPCGPQGPVIPTIDHYLAPRGHASGDAAAESPPDEVTPRECDVGCDCEEPKGGCDAPGCDSPVAYVCSCQRCASEDDRGKFHACAIPSHSSIVRIRHEHIYPNHAMRLNSTTNQEAAQ